MLQAARLVHVRAQIRIRREVQNAPRFLPVCSERSDKKITFGPGGVHLRTPSVMLHLDTTPCALLCFESTSSSSNVQAVFPSNSHEVFVQERVLLPSRSQSQQLIRMLAYFSVPTLFLSHIWFNVRVNIAPASGTELYG